ncbi:MAG: YbcC family protein [Pseudomonadota bacterium]
MLVRTRADFTGVFLEIVASARTAARAIPPAWPLEATVAVNPFLGQAEGGLAEAAARLGRVGGVRVTMPRSWYRRLRDEGEVTDADIRAAAGECAQGPYLSGVLSGPAADPAADPAAPVALPTVADLAARASGIDWPGIITDRIGVWAASFFDRGQAPWPAETQCGAFAAWRVFATHDLTPEIQGLKGFARLVADGPDQAWTSLARSADLLGLTSASAESYFHALLHDLGGWAQAARWMLWQAEQRGDADDTLTDLLAIRLFWEEALVRQYGGAITGNWSAVCDAHAAPVGPSDDQRIDAILQRATEHAAQRRLAALLSSPRPAAAAPARPQLQAVFCIDVRSEIFRRALEAQGGGIETLGFAGFFGLPLVHRALGSVEAEPHLPVLLSPALATEAPADPAVEAAARISARARRAWGRFRQAAVSSFAFVEAAGPAYGWNLLKDSLHLGHRHDLPEPPPAFLDLSPAARIDTAATVLRAMSLTSGFAPVVILTGHGASTVNNPQASALQCGACGGRTGAVSARALAGILNDPAVRAGLAESGIAIPPDTRFVGALHDTTLDRVTLFDIPAEEFRDIRAFLDRAGEAARAERAPLLPRAGKPAAIAKRATDWAETRPEWGLAGCNAFIAAPRERTRGRSFGGQVFLHSYDWRADQGFRTLELILTAPVVVASWISLQYYGSVVAPEVFGAGNKLLHNVVGGIGVLEGNGGRLRTGLAWQSVHDGRDLRHRPLRLSVVIEAPTAEISKVLDRHPGVRQLFDNGWLHLLVLGDSGRLAWRRTPEGAWAPFGDRMAEVA